MLLPFCAKRDVERIDQLTDRQLNDLTVSLLDGSGSRSGRALSKHTVHSYIRAVNAFLAWARKDGETVTAKAKLPTLGRRVLDVLSREEIQALEDAAETERDKLIVRVLADTGMRLGGLLGLTLADMHQDGRTFSLRVHEKGDKQRLVPVRPELYRRLRRFAEKTRRDADSDRVFLAHRRSPRTGQYEPLEASGINQLFVNLAELAGMHKRCLSAPAAPLVRDALPPPWWEPVALAADPRPRQSGHDHHELLAPDHQRRARRGDADPDRRLDDVPGCPQGLVVPRIRQQAL